MLPWTAGWLAGYDFRAGYPMAPIRVELTIELARAFGLFAAAGVSVQCPAPATDVDLATVHLQQYIAAVRHAGGPEPDDSAADFGLGTQDNPVFAGMHDASALVAGATLAAARAVWTGAAQHGASIAGGLYHAMSASASGFCVYNDPAIAISWLLQAGAGRVAYVDLDVHHGDGVQAAFYDDPRVLTISLHEHPAMLWPGRCGYPVSQITAVQESRGTAGRFRAPPTTAWGAQVPAHKAGYCLRRGYRALWPVPVDSGVVTSEVTRSARGLGRTLSCSSRTWGAIASRRCVLAANACHGSRDCLRPTTRR